MAVKFQIISVLQDDCRMVGRKGGEDELPSLLSFHIVLVQGRFFGRCCRIAVSSVDGMRRLSPFYVNNDQEGITKVGWMIIIHISHACIRLRWSAEEGSPVIERVLADDVST